MKNKPAIYVTLLLLMSTLINPRLYAGRFHVAADLLGGYTHTFTFNDIIASDVSYRMNERNFNAGFAIAGQFDIDNRYFIKAGIRYYNYHFNIYLSPVAIASFVNLGNTFHTFSVPVLFGKNVAVLHGHKMELYGGIAAGIMLPDWSIYVENGRMGDWIIRNKDDPNNMEIRPFYIGLNAGIHYYPCHKVPLSIGLLCGVQLNKTHPFRFDHYVSTPDNKSYSYALSYSQRTIDCMITLSYTFGRHGNDSNTRTNPYDCPK